MNVKMIFSFITGAAVGGVVTYFIFDKKNKKEYEQKLTNEMLEFTREMSSVTEEDLENLTDTVTNKAEEPVKSKIEVVDVKKPIADTINTSITNYKKLAGQYSEEEIQNLSEDEWREIAMKPHLDENDPMPYVITEEVHEMENNCYDCEELVYNLISEELYNDITGETVDECDIDVCIGVKNLKDFIKSDDDEIYIRNKGWATDYIVRKEYDK